ncbi:MULTISPECIES: hypothetical protein [unclassified Nodularia (in: cyanobacteria)]|uniref:hypothetical protein n=1 Tax=unclassified Nodularia (in: cyanobacteria) TaxID=2656917 RepID=UPI00187E4DA6|nr:MULTISPECIES: hypothetical protein [unclassified Nodularia (in: cyanobacteria)]MBE9199561.1 hypothetical protein [Nodularia sp. LEGE 06071]MCC2691374.1 hypothetical protein [Nodularia sp. LEGE 04288]
MTLLHKITSKFARNNTQNISGIDPSLISQTPIVQKPPTTPKTLAELEQEILKSMQVPSQSVVQKHGKTNKGIGSKLGTKLIWIAILLGIPAGVLWVVNLPYPIIRRPMMQNASFLLLPSYISIEQNYRQALASMEQAEQLIEKPTSTADLALGEQQLQQTKIYLNNLPVGLINDRREYPYGWYDWRFSVYGLNAARRQVGQLEAKVFQEKNAQTLLTEHSQAFQNAKQQYQQATTVADKKSAIAAWRSALDNLEEIPGQTLAGKTAQSQLDVYKRDFQEVVGLAAGNERVSTLITAAQQFSWQAAKAAQNPPHTVTEWQQIENLWSQAINRIKLISSEDVVGYAEAQKLLAIYETNLGQIKVRRQAEADSVQALAVAQRQIESLLASIPTDPQNLQRNRVISQLHSIINQLEKVQAGTTVYLKAQELLLSANNKLKQLQ